MITGRRPHPFVGHAELQALARRATSNPSWTFDTSTTEQTLEWVATQQPELAAELDELYRFGDVVSYASIQDAIYTVVYNAIGKNVHVLAECEPSDGITARNMVRSALQSAWDTDPASAAFKTTTDMRELQITTGPEPIAEYFGKLRTLWDQTAQGGARQKHPESDVVGMALFQIINFHPQLRSAMVDLQRRARKTADPEKELTFAKVRSAAINAWRYEVSKADRQKLQTKSTIAGAVTTGVQIQGAELVAPGKRQHPKMQRYLQTGRGPPDFFLPGGCRNCAACTSHITRGCHITKRANRVSQEWGGSMPAGAVWCPTHTKGWHLAKECHKGKQKRKHEKDKADTIAALVRAEVLAACKKHFRTPAPSTATGSTVGTPAAGQQAVNTSQTEAMVNSLAAVINSMDPKAREQLGERIC